MEQTGAPLRMLRHADRLYARQKTGTKVSKRPVREEGVEDPGSASGDRAGPGVRWSNPNREPRRR